MLRTVLAVGIIAFSGASWAAPDEDEIKTEGAFKASAGAIGECTGSCVTDAKAREAFKRTIVFEDLKPLVVQKAEKYCKSKEGSPPAVPFGGLPCGTDEDVGKCSVESKSENLLHVKCTLACMYQCLPPASDPSPVPAPKRDANYKKAKSRKASPKKAVRTGEMPDLGDRRVYGEGMKVLPIEVTIEEFRPKVAEAKPKKARVAVERP